VYVKKVNERGDWLDEDECDIDNSPEETIKKLEEQTRIAFPNFQGLSTLKKKIIVYHKNYKPIETANCVFKRIKND
jgi:hypothetical protein